MKILKDKTAIITGATRGIGRGIAETFAKHGANVIFTYSSSSDLAKEIENELSKEGVIVKGYKSDASNFNDCENLINKIVNDFPVIDILILLFDIFDNPCTIASQHSGLTEPYLFIIFLLTFNILTLALFE